MSADFLARLKENPRPVVVDFWAPWCGPCKAIEPVLKNLATDYAGRVDVWKINADDQPEVLRALNIFGIPTLIAFHNGQEVARHTGAAGGNVLSTLFEAALAGNAQLYVAMAPLDRFLRLGAGAALFVLAWQQNFAGWGLLLAAVGLVLAFSAIHDRCPIYRALKERLKTWRGRGEAVQ